MKTMLCLVAFISLSITIHASPSTDSIISRYRQFFLKDLNVQAVTDSAARYVSTLNPQKQWTDIDYTDGSPTYWRTRSHLDRVIALALAYTTPASRFYNDPEVFATLSAALDHWLLKRYQNSNWWHNEIGVPQYFRIILALIYTKLSPAQLQQSLEVLGQHRVKGVGANLIWSADLAIHYGAFAKNEDIIRKNSALIGKEIKVSKGEGIQPDYSFHQHDERLQTYHYGLSFVAETVRIAWELRDTEWAIPRDKIKILSDYLFNGWQWMARGIHTIPGTIDRAASRIGQLQNADLRPLTPYLKLIDPVNAAAYQIIADRQNGIAVQPEGFRYYPYSDFSAYHRKDFSFLLKTISNRTLTTEHINSENLKGRFINNGDGYMITDGSQYFDLMPVWNWKYLPGQTNAGWDSAIARFPYAGSVTDGRSGLTAMEYGITLNKDSITAHKFWACHNNTVICLVAGLKSTNASDSIFTALDQSRWKGNVEVNRPGNIIRTKGTNPLNGVRWIYHSNIGYIPLEPSFVQLHLNSTTGAWSDINISSPSTPITEQLFMPLLYHNKAQGASYGYVMAYCKSSEALQALSAKPTWKVISNTPVCQAVQFSDGTIMAAFFASGKIQLPGNGNLAADKPCLIQVAKDRIFISDPLHLGSGVNIRMTNKNYRVKMNSDGTTIGLGK